MPSTSGKHKTDVLIGNQNQQIAFKTIRSPGVLSCGNTAVNPQHASWNDQFKVVVDPAAETVTVTRLDWTRGWGQQLVLRCLVSQQFNSGATKSSCDAACAGFQYFGVQAAGECWCGNSYGKYGAIPGQCNVDGPFFGNNKNVVYRRGPESENKVLTRSVRIYTKGRNGELCGLRAASTVGIPLATVGATGHLALWDCSSKSDPIKVTGKIFSTTIENKNCKLRQSVKSLEGAHNSATAAFWDCAADAAGSNMLFSSTAIMTSSANLAKGRPTLQSSTAYRGSSKRAVDGNTNSRYGKNSCTHTKRDRGGAWWRVDLERIAAVSRVVITNRKDCCQKRIKNTDVFVGLSDVFSEAKLCGSLIYSNTNPIVVNCASPLSGRYVWVKKSDARTILTLCEVEVFAAAGSAITPAPLQSSPFIYTTGLKVSATETTTSCGLSQHNHEGVPSTVVFGNQFSAIFDGTGSATPVQIGDEIPTTSELYYDDHNADGSVKTEGWRVGMGSSSVVGGSEALKTLTYGATSTAVTSCAGQSAPCRQMHGPFAKDTTTTLSKEWKNLPKHTALRVKARIWSVGSFDNEHVQIKTSNKALSEIKPKYTYIGCYRDSRRRDLYKYMGRGYHQSTCSAKCRQFKFFSLQYNGECFCDNNYGKYGRKNDRDCTMERGKSALKSGCGKCRGGSWRNAVYRQEFGGGSGSVGLPQVAWINRRQWNSPSSRWEKMNEPVWNPWSGGRGGAFYDHVNFVVEHDSNDFSLVLHTSVNQNADDEYMAFSDVQLHILTTSSTMYCGQAVEHKKATTISCANEETISSIVFASYGTPLGTASTCSTDSYSISPSCHAATSKRVLESMCLQKNKCILSAHNKIYGDPCRGTRKWLWVQYRCSAPPTVPSLPKIAEATKPAAIVPRAKPASCPSDVSKDFVGCLTVPENSREGAKVGVMVASTAPGQLVYTLQSNAQGLFSIETNGGAVSLSGAGELDFEVKRRYEVVVRIADTVSGLYTAGRVLISISDVNEPPKFVINTGRDIDENSKAGTFVGEALQATDVDAGDSLTYKLTGGSGIFYFNISASARIAVSGNSTLDHETTPVLVLHVRATDTTGLSASTTLIVSVNDVNEKPEFPLTDYSFEIPEHTSGKIGDPVLATDVDLGQKLEYKILSVEPTDIPITSFDIDSCSGQIRLAAPVLNYEKNVLYTLTVQATDNGAVPLGLYSFVEVHIEITDENDTPTFLQRNYLIEADENSPAGRIGNIIVATGTFDEVNIFLKFTSTFFTFDCKFFFDVSNKFFNILS
jgi:hypothetical protein